MYAPLQALPGSLTRSLWRQNSVSYLISTSFFPKPFVRIAMSSDAHAHGQDHDSMYEVEKKVSISPSSSTRLQRDAKRKTTKRFIDIYYDNPQFEWTQRDYWLRQRDSLWELKVPQPSPDHVVDHYLEITSIPLIISTLELGESAESHLNDDSELRCVGRSVDLESCLRLSSIVPFARIQTERQSLLFPNYQGHLVSVDEDVVRFYDPDGGVDILGEYSIAEVEVVVKSKEEEGDAHRVVDKFNEEYGIASFTQEQPRGKVLEYIARYSSKHYAALQRSGLLSRKLGHVEKPE